VHRPTAAGLLALVSILSLAACDTLVRSPEPRPADSAVGRQPGAETAGRGQAEAAEIAPWEDPASPIYRRTIYFRYDRNDILPEYAPLLRTHADYLARHPGARITIEGHTDERGTREYNLALGDRRAAAVQAFLIAEGVAAGQLETLSYGEEKPASAGHRESAWSLNRRAELDYEGP